VSEWNGWKVAALAIVLLVALALFRPDVLDPLRWFSTSILTSLKGLVPQ